jgi:hypothetical protein
MDAMTEAEVRQAFRNGSRVRRPRSRPARCRTPGPALAAATARLQDRLDLFAARVLDRS